MTTKTINSLTWRAACLDETFATMSDRTEWTVQRIWFWFCELDEMEVDAE